VAGTAAAGAGTVVVEAGRIVVVVVVEAGMIVVVVVVEIGAVASGAVYYLNLSHQRNC
jgi:hypothetical protein